MHRRVRRIITLNQVLWRIKILNVTEQEISGVYINDYIIDDCIGRFCDFINSYLTSGEAYISPDFTDRIELFFSNKKERDSYCKDCLKTIVRDIIKKKSGIPLKDEQKSKIKKASTRQEVLAVLEDVRSSHDDKKVNDAVEHYRKRVIKAPVTSPYVAGEYIHTGYNGRLTPVIVLYPNVIRKKKMNVTEFQDAFERVFAHELFHAYHYYLCREVSSEIEKRHDYTARVVKESLAKFFERKYCESYHIPTDVESGRDDGCPSVDPYSGARYLNADNSCPIIKLSLTDMDAALRSLLSSDADVFYAVKNVSL